MKGSKAALGVFLVCAVLAFYTGTRVEPRSAVTLVELDTDVADDGTLVYRERGKVRQVYPLVKEPSSWEGVERSVGSDAPLYVYRGEGSQREYFRVYVQRHYGFLSLLPAIVAIFLCWMTREPMTSLFAGVITGALLLGKYDITDEVFLETFTSKNAAGVLLLYLWMLGGLLGIWSRSGAGRAFAEFMARRFVRGPRSAKLVAWCLGIVFFQGGTISTVLTGTTVKPLADRHKVSHEELSYIVDSTASPIASQLAFNAWPGYVQTFIFVAGVPFLATESLRIRFFFESVPFCFYAIFAVLGTFLLSIEKAPFLGKQMREAMRRSREFGLLDREGSEPLSSPELDKDNVPEYYHPHIVDFLVPLLVLIGVCLYTFWRDGSPQVRWAFGGAVLSGAGLALARGMKLFDLVGGIIQGLKGVVFGSVILLLAITIGTLSRESGGGVYLVELLGDSIPYYLLPVFLQLLTIVISFSTGTSWGTYAVSFPLAMPLAWAVAQSNGLEHPHFFMTICFAAVMDGSVYGDQCSPISDTTVLSSMCTGCDLMDHVKTQIPQATAAALLAAFCWTATVLVFA